MDWLKYLKQAVEHEASDVFFVAGGPVCEKLEGHIRHMDEMRLLPPDTEAVVRSIYELAGRDISQYLVQGDDDFSFSLAGVARFRVNTYRQRGSMAAVVRVVSFDIPDWQAMGIPPAVMNLADLTSGMILVTGTAGTAKYTPVIS